MDAEELGVHFALCAYDKIQENPNNSGSTYTYRKILMPPYNKPPPQYPSPLKVK